MASEADDIVAKYEAFRRAYRADELASLRADVERENQTPKRYQSKTADGTWTELIRDEDEWLVRPAINGYWPELARANTECNGDLLRHPFQPFNTASTIECVTCRENALKLSFTALITLEEIRERCHFRSDMNFQDFFGASLRCDCQYRLSITRLALYHVYGFTTNTEFKIGFAERLNEHTDRFARVLGQFNSSLVKEFDLMQRQYGRWLALELLGPNPYRPIAFDPRWNTSTVATLAESIHTNDSYDAMPILAVALEDAGCEQPYILTHCRQPLPHIRGCWVVQLILHSNMTAES